jgi:hypothetical protein
VYSVLQPSGGTFIRFADGTTYTTKAGTEIIEKRRYHPIDYAKAMRETLSEIEEKKELEREYDFWYGN